MSLVARVIPEENSRQGQTQNQQSFPGFFKNSGKNKRHLSKCHRPIVVAKAQKTFDISVSLLGCKSDTTPSISEELELIQAGLGKRTLSLTCDTTHAELSSLLQEMYSKMSGNGRRRISVIPLEAEGYTGSVIKSASGGGKNLLYIVPLQDELDMTPLSPDAPEFARMPKATCKKSKTLMPLQTLALHVDQCDSMQNSENSEIEEDDLLLVEEATSSRQSLSPKVGTSNFEHQVHQQS
ncbi:Desmocollin-1 [Labeo rohita]|uniref:Desmocollin-1 n=1 Tax=Labeo rohita TaxID=84645 RepID=A0ABQ8L504_LABRO|nr:Desmocollin-1 [Labeo rohita]